MLLVQLFVCFVCVSFYHFSFPLRKDFTSGLGLDILSLAWPAMV